MWLWDASWETVWPQDHILFPRLWTVSSGLVSRVSCPIASSLSIIIIFFYSPCWSLLFFYSSCLLQWTKGKPWIHNSFVHWLKNCIQKVQRAFKQRVTQFNIFSANVLTWYVLRDAWWKRFFWFCPGLGLCFGERALFTILFVWRSTWYKVVVLSFFKMFPLLHAV